MARRPLRAVPAAEEIPPVKRAPAKRAKPAVVKTIAEAAKTDDRRALAVAIRDRVALALSKPDCPPREIGVLLKHLEESMNTIAELDKTAEKARTASTTSDSTDDRFDAAAI